MLELSEDHFSRRFVLYAYHDVIYHVDYSRTVAHVTFGVGFDRFIQIASKHLQVVGSICTVGIIVYWLIVLAVPAVMIRPLFCIVWAIGLVHNIVSLFRMQYDIVVLCFQTFEIVFITFLVGLMITTLGTMTKWPLEITLAAPFMTASYLNTILLDAWPLGFVRFRRSIIEMRKDLQRQENRAEKNKGGSSSFMGRIMESISNLKRGWSFGTTRHHKVSVLHHVSEQKLEPPHVNEPSFVKTPSNSCNAIIQPPKIAFIRDTIAKEGESLSFHELGPEMIYKSIAIFYSVISKYTTIASTAEKIRRSFLIFFSHGAQYVVTLIGCWMVTFSLYLHVRWHYIKDLHDRPITGAPEFTTTGVIFRACCLNLLAFFGRRIGLQLFYPYKVLCVKQRPVRIPLVQEWLPVIDLIRQRKKKVFSYLDVEKGEAVLHAPHCSGFKINADAKDDVCKIPCDAEEGLSVNHAELPEQDKKNTSNPIVNVKKAMESNIMMENPPESVVQGRIDPKFTYYRKGIITGPIHEEMLVDFSRILIDSIASKFMVRWFYLFRKYMMRFTLPFVFVSAISSLVFSIYQTDLYESISYIIYIIAVIHQALVIISSATDAIFKSLRIFENWFLVINAILFSFVLAQYLDYQGSRAHVGPIYIFLVSLSMTFTDAQPLPLSKLKKLLMELQTDLQEGREIPEKIQELYTLGLMLESRFVDSSQEIGSKTEMKNHVKQIDIRTLHTLPGIVDASYWNHRKKPLFQLYPASTAPVLLVGVLWYLALLVVVQARLLYNQNHVVFDLFLIDYDNIGILSTLCITFAIFMTRRLWGFIKDPVRCVSFERRSVRIPLIPEFLES